MKRPLTYGDQCFIAEKQNRIREYVHKKEEIKKQINALLGEIEFLEIDIDSYRYSIRKKLGRE